MAGPSVTIEMSGDEFKLLRSLQKVIDKNREMDKSLKDVEKAGDQAGKKIGKSIDDSNSAFDRAKSKVGELALSFGGVGAAVALVTSAIGEMNKSIEEAKKATEQLSQGRWNLASIADNPEEYRRFQAESDRLATTYGLQREQANRLVFSADSAGYMDHLDYAARVAQQFGQAPVEEVAAKLPGMFGGRINATQALAGTAIAMKESPADFGQIASAVANATQGGKFSGSSPEEVLASLSVMAGQFGQVSTAGDRLKGFGVTLPLRSPELQGLGFVEMTKRLQAMTPEQRTDILGESIELNEAYQSMSQNLALIQERTATVRREMDVAGTSGDRVSQIEANFLSSRPNQALLGRERNRMKAEIVQEREMAESGFAAESYRLNERTKAMEQGYSWFDLSLGKSLGDQAEGWLGPWAGRSVEMLGRNASNITSVTAAMSRFEAGREALDRSRSEAARAAREAIIEVGRQQAGPSTLARPDVDR